MSSEKTRVYRLHLWEPEDSFIRSEFNENTQNIEDRMLTIQNMTDEATRVVSGTYTGNGMAGTTQFISLSGTPFAVLVEMREGIRGTRGGSLFGGLALRSHPVGDSNTPCVSIQGQGFLVRNDHSHNYWSNEEGSEYYYLALY